MKARITTVLSLTGVLVAGSAAALVNTQVLQNSTPKQASASEISVDDQPASESTSAPVAAAGAPLGNKVEGVLAVAVTVAAPAVTTQQGYAIGEAATVVLDRAGDVLTIVSVTPNAGWTVVDQENKDPFTIEIKLQSADTLIEFEANLIFGVVGTSVESQSLTKSTTGNTTATSGGTTRTTHDDDDSHEDDDDSGSHHGGGSDDDD